MPLSHGLRGASFAILGVALCSLSAPAQAGLTLPAASLSDSLTALSRAASVEILADPALLRGKRAPAVRAAPTAEGALDELLRGSGLRYLKRGGTFLIVRSARPPQRTAAVTPRIASPSNRSGPSTPPAEPGVAADASIVVTGTHIARPELHSAMPISVIRMDDARNYARDTIYDVLLLDPAIGPGLGESNSQGQEYDVGVANINLRGMGNNRSLVLVDGQRWVSGGARISAVDLNTIPSAMIDRIEVVTGGAAAIYGADAVTGAVNVIMKKSMAGVQLSATDGISSRGDARQSNLSLATGFRFGGGRGRFVFGGDYGRKAPLRWAERYDRRQTYYANPANTGPHDGIPDMVLAHNYGSFYRSAVPSFYVGNQWYQYRQGSVVPVDYDVPVTPGETGTGDGGPVTTGFENHLLRNASERGSLYAHLAYELSPAVSWSATFSYAHSYARAVPEWPEVRTDGRPANWWGGTTGEIATLANPWLPDPIRQFMLARGITALPLDRTYFNLPQAYEIHRRNNISFGTELAGPLAGGLNWMAFVRYGEVTDRIETTNMVGKAEWLRARDTIVDPATGQIVCADPAARASGCVPLNFFSTEPYSPALLAYIERSRYERNENSLLNAGGTLSGNILRLPHGDVSIAAGVEWRRETLHTRDDPDTEKLADIIISPGSDYAFHPALDAVRDTIELYGEVEVPLLRDLPFARRLEIEGAYRLSSYSDNPDTHTWKAGGSWEPIAGFTLRGVFSHSIRVPNFGELFSPLSQAIYGHINDPCQAGAILQNANRIVNCAALLPGLSLPLPNPNLNAPVIYSGGNPELTPETSNSFTLGAVFQPKLVTGFDMTVDYWNIRIDDIITSLSYTTILNSCVDSPGGPNPVYCQFVQRNADGTVNFIHAQYANLAGQHARGIDFGANYRAPFGKGLLRAGFRGTYLLEQTTITQRGSPGVDYAGQWNYPRVRATLTASYSLGKVTLGLNSRFISGSAYSIADASEETRDPRHVPAYLYNDLMVQVRPVEKFSLTIGVKNISNADIFAPLRDTAPGPHGSGGVATGAAYYDPVGRYFFTRVDLRF
ncbi:TonB-dependent receptor [Edaphosphingomonas haloaromaticamans]|uniref:Colicin I receptor n=1 Tax=Edaphosphingomonas haloaromaticamans TaxID=653954 RepID=A0A1S1HGK9_9SPHN|nr:TonB-dependent receptor [Sphingomonas haloaromaticamans]OHT20621.1 Colicin I receptor precursor [Sphingomonas haloaromaticamans]